MTVLDSSAVVDYLLGAGSAASVRSLLARGTLLSAPDVLAFEVVAVLRRLALGHVLSDERARQALEDLGATPVELFPCIPLRWRAWQMRHNFAVADALFVALAEALGEPLATTDGALAAAVTRHTDVAVEVLA